MMAERGVVVGHATIHRWSIKMMPALAAVLRRRKRPLATSWRTDGIYTKVNGVWQYLYRAVDRAGHAIDFLLRAHRDLAAARCFFGRAIDLHGVPEKITIDKSGANTAAIVGMCANNGADIEMRQSKYLNNLIEQDHRAVKRIGNSNALCLAPCRLVRAVGRACDGLWSRLRRLRASTVPPRRVRHGDLFRVRLILGNSWGFLGRMDPSRNSRALLILAALGGRPHEQ